MIGIFRRRYMADCGHETFKKDKMSAFGVERKLILIEPENGVEFCHRCLEKMTIRCAWCGKPIFTGDSVTICGHSDDFVVPEYAHFYTNDPAQLVGCMRRGCGEIFFRSGAWMPPGIVERTPSLIEMVMETREPVCIPDVSKMAGF